MEGCAQKISISDNVNEKETALYSNMDISMPEIVFDYTFVYDYGETNQDNNYVFVFIDKEGDVYYGEDKGYFYNLEEISDLYETLINNKICKKVNTVSIGQLFQNYGILNQIVKDGMNEVEVEESTLDVCQGQHKWKGYYYDEYGKTTYIILYGKGDRCYINSDTRTKEIVDWINNLFDIPASILEYQ